MNKSLQQDLQNLKINHELLSAMLLIAENDWEAAHEIAQKKEGTSDYDELHALLHRIEGDEWNAKYWYRRINKPYGKTTIEAEWNELTQKFIKKYSQ